MTSQTSKPSRALAVAGLSSKKKLRKRNPTAFNIFCGMKLREVNNGEIYFCPEKVF